MAIERTDWTYEKPVSRHEQPLPGSTAVVPVARDATPSQMLAEYEANDWRTDSEPAGDPLAGLTEDQIAQAQIVTEMLIGDHPDRESFEQVFDRLSAPLQNKIFTIMATMPHLRGLDLVDRIERTLTLDETVEAERWLKSLSPAHRQILRG